MYIRVRKKSYLDQMGVQRAQVQPLAQYVKVTYGSIPQEQAVKHALQLFPTATHAQQERHRRSAPSVIHSISIIFRIPPHVRSVLAPMIL
jgi:hypothetical protein